MIKHLGVSCLVCIMVVLVGCPKKPEVRTAAPAMVAPEPAMVEEEVVVVEEEVVVVEEEELIIERPRAIGRPQLPPMEKPTSLRETGRSFLLKDQTETDGYSLYSYLLFGSKPFSSTTYERYQAAIDAFLQLVTHIKKFEERGVPPGELNIFYLPLQGNDLPADHPRAEWVLENYDYVRARLLLRRVPGTNRNGPYIISVKKPISRVNRLSGKYLRQDMSIVPASVVFLWVKAFITQAEKQRFWEQSTIDWIVLDLRTRVAIFAEGLPDVQASLSSIIGWF